MARKQSWSDAEIVKAASLIIDGLSWIEVAEALGRTRHSVTNKGPEIQAEVARIRRSTFTMSDIPSAGRPVAEIISARRDAFQRKKDHHDQHVCSSRKLDRTGESERFELNLSTDGRIHGGG